MSEALLPEMFKELEPFTNWALEPERARTEEREASSMVEVRAFYDAMMPRFDEILDHLQGHFGADMPAPAHRLYLMSLSLVEVAILVELYKQRESVVAYDPLRYERRF